MLNPSIFSAASASWWAHSTSASASGDAEPSGVLLTGGGARSEAVRVVAPGIFGVPVDVPEPEEYVALGAARQAAWALAGTPEPPAWPRRPAARYEGTYRPEIRERFIALRDATTAWDAEGSAGDAAP